MKLCIRRNVHKTWRRLIFQKQSWCTVFNSNDSFVKCRTRRLPSLSLCTVCCVGIDTKSSQTRKEKKYIQKDSARMVPCLPHRVLFLYVLPIYAISIAIFIEIILRNEKDIKKAKERIKLVARTTCVSQCSWWVSYVAHHLANQDKLIRDRVLLSAQRVSFAVVCGGCQSQPLIW